MSDTLKTFGYRVLKTDDGFSLYEVYYDDQGEPEAYTSSPMVNFYCESPDAVKLELKDMMNAFSLPALDVKEIGNSK